MLSGRKAAYIAQHFRDYSDAAMAAELDVSQDDIRGSLRKQGLKRTQAESVALKKSMVPAPRFLWSAPVLGESVFLGRMDFVLGIVCGLAALAVYLLTLAPSVTGEDSGELITAAYTLGIAHPPGYPIWCLLGHAFTYIPIGSVAWRVNLMSAFFAAVTVGLVVLIARKLGAGQIAAAGAALCFAYSREFWEQSVIAEVYTLNAFFIVACLLIVMVWYERRQHRWLFLLAAVFGFGICNHNTVAMLGPVFALFVLWLEPHWRRYGVYAGCIVLALGIAALVHLYLPIRSAANPPVDWGNPENWENFKDVVTRAQYSFMYTDDPRTLGRFVRHLGMLTRFYVWEFGGWIAFLPILGLPLLWKSGGHRFTLICVLAVILSIGYILILNTKFERESMWVATVFYIPFYMIAAVLLALGVQWIVNKVSSRGPFVAACLAIVCAVSPLALNWHHNNRCNDSWARDYAANIFKTLDENAIYFPTSDHATFPAIYLQTVEGLRPDITIANKYGYPEPALYEGMPEPMRAQFGKIPNSAEENIIETWIIENHSERPVYFTTKNSFPRLNEYSLAQTGLVYRVVRPGEEIPDRDYWAEYEWRTLEPEDMRDDYTASLIIADVNYARAREQFEYGEKDAALESLRLATEAIGENKESLNNFGSLCAENSAYDAAQAYFEQASALDDGYLTPLRNLAKMHLNNGETDSALVAIDKILASRPMDYETVWLKVEVLKDTPRAIEAIDLLEEVTRVAPEDSRAWRELGYLYLNLLRDGPSARAAFARSLSIDPNQKELQRIMTGDTASSGDRLPRPPIPGPTIPNASLP